LSHTADHFAADTIASASTCDLGSKAAQSLAVTGTTTITSFGTIKAGTVKFLNFTGALLLTHNATSLILPGGANITTAAGDTAIVRSLGSGNWRCLSYQPAAGVPLSLTGIASQTDMESNASNTAIVTPGRLKYGLPIPKVWMQWDGSSSPLGGYNVSALVDNGAGDTTVTIDTDLSAAGGAIAGISSTTDSTRNDVICTVFSNVAGSVRVRTFDQSAAALADVAATAVVVFGDLP
jgi:hypothetical protein